MSLLELLKTDCEMLLKVEQEKFCRERKVVATRKTMPNGKENECDQLAEMNVAHKFETAINVLECEFIRGHIVRANDGRAGVCKLVFGQIHIRVSVKVDAIWSDSTQDTRGFSHQPNGNKFVHIDFGNNGHCRQFPPNSRNFECLWAQIVNGPVDWTIKVDE